MVKLPHDPPLGVGAVVRAALSHGLKTAHIAAFVAELRELARQEAGLVLRLAMVLSCIKRFDVAELGYSGFHAFCRERVDWGWSWVRALVRLVESPLHRVKAAAAAGRVPLRVAVGAPGRVRVHEQVAWLGEAVLGLPARGPSRVVLGDDDADVVRVARELARILMGRRASRERIDAFILGHWRARIPGAALEEGRRAPPAPEPCALDFGWAIDQGRAAPAEALLGPWCPPADLAEAVEQLDAVQAVRRGRVAVLARAFALVCAEDDWRGAGFDSPWAFARTVLGWSRSSAGRHLELGVALGRFPQLDAAVREGLSLESASRIAGLADSPVTCNRWVEIARHLGQQEMFRAVANGGERLGDYERAWAIARRHAEALLGPDGPTTRPSGTVDAFVTPAASATS